MKRLFLPSHIVKREEKSNQKFHRRTFSLLHFNFLFFFFPPLFFFFFGLIKPHVCHTNYRKKLVGVQ